MNCPKQTSAKSCGVSYALRPDAILQIPKGERMKLPAGMHVFERGWLSSNCILFDDGHTSQLVDSGYCTHAAQTLALVTAKLGARPLNLLLNTHLHSDHCGGNEAFQAHFPDLVTSIPPGQAALVSTWDPVGLFYTPTGQLCPQFNFQTTLQIGSTISLGHAQWDIYSAGGHDPDAVIFFEPANRVLISADALWQHGFGVIFPELEGIAAFDNAASTLDLIERLDPLVTIPGHGSVFQNTPLILATARNRLNAFVKDPVKHARHGAKVLLKFKLLEKQKLPMVEFLSWAINTPCLLQCQHRFFEEMHFDAWINQLCDELVRAGVAARDSEYILNL